MARHKEEPERDWSLRWLSTLFWGAAAACIVGTVAAGVKIAQDPIEYRTKEARVVVVPTLKPTQTSTPTPTPTPVHFEDCADAKKRGALPLTRDDPGYRKALDSDADGKACENYH